MGPTQHETQLVEREPLPNYYFCLGFSESGSIVQRLIQLQKGGDARVALRLRNVLSRLVWGPNCAGDRGSAVVISLPLPEKKRELIQYEAGNEGPRRVYKLIWVVPLIPSEFFFFLKSPYVKPRERESGMCKKYKINTFTLSLQMTWWLLLRNKLLMGKDLLFFQSNKHAGGTSW